MGGSTIGIIINDELSYQGFPAGAAVLQLDEVGRRFACANELDQDETCEIQSVLNEHDVTLLGFYSGVEVAPLLGRSRGLDWTGVLLVLTEG